MKIYEIVDHNGKVVCYVKAGNEKHALCVYLATHDELTDVMLWISATNRTWKLAEYDNEEEFLTARKVTEV